VLLLVVLLLALVVAVVAVVAGCVRQPLLQPAVATTNILPTRQQPRRLLLQRPQLLLLDVMAPSMTHSSLLYWPPQASRLGLSLLAAAAAAI
jgi:hypothetical protein